MRNEILSAIEKNSKIDVKELAVLLGQQEVDIMNEIATMEKEGIGRPSTYASTLDLIKAREYVVVNKTQYKPTEQGKLTISKLMESFDEIINIEYTANMETKLDEIAEGKCSSLEALTDFYNTFIELYKVAKVEMVKQEPIKEDLGLCPQFG